MNTRSKTRTGKAGIKENTDTNPLQDTFVSEQNVCPGHGSSSGEDRHGSPADPVDIVHVRASEVEEDVRPHVSSPANEGKREQNEDPAKPTALYAAVR